MREYYVGVLPEVKISANLTNDLKIKAINNWAKNNPDLVFEDSFKGLRKYITEDTWKLIIKNPKNPILSINDKRWEKIPNNDKLRSKVFSGEVSRGMNKYAKIPLIAASIPAAVIGGPVIAPSILSNLGNIALGTVGSVAGDLITDKIIKLTTDKDSWADWFADKTKTSKDLGYLTNPGGWILGGLPIAGKNLLLNKTNLGKIYQISSALNKNIKNTSKISSVFDPDINLGRVGWGESLVLNGHHYSLNPNLKLKRINLDNWAVINHNAPSNVSYLTEGLDSKSMVSKRPYKYNYIINAKKPIIQIGEITPKGFKNNFRNSLLRESEGIGADFNIFKGIKDNKATNQTIIGVQDTETLIPGTIFSKSLNPSVNTSYAFLQRPSKISELEKLGLNKDIRQMINKGIGKGWNLPYQYSLANSNIFDNRTLGMTQRLRDEHFRRAFPDTYLKDKYGNIQDYYHGTRSVFDAYKYDTPEHLDIGLNINRPFGNYGIGMYAFAGDPKRASEYAGEGIGYLKHLYGTSKNHLFVPEKSSNKPYMHWNYTSHPLYKSNIKELNDRIDYKEIIKQRYQLLKDWGVTDFSEIENMKDLDRLFRSTDVISHHKENVFKNSNQLKYADPITFTEDGYIIPLSIRDDIKNPNFNYKKGGPIIKVN